MTRTLVRHIAETLQARINCQQAVPPNTEWFARHTENLRQLERDCLPSGSGLDSGCKIDLDRSKPNRIVLSTSFHHMNDGGMYDGWTDHDIIVTPDLASGLTLRITGRDRNGIKEYLYDVFDCELNREYEHTYNRETDTSAFRHVVAEHHAAV